MDAIRSDPELSALIDEHGELELAPAEDTFGRFVTSIVRQQLSMASARSIRERLFEELTEIRGVGTWTAKMFLLFCLAREDVFPVEDLGIRQGMTERYGIDDRAAMIEKATGWRPHRSYASLYLRRATD